MNQVIRRGVFETNSSSSHSITIAGGDFKPDRLFPDDDGRLSVYAGQFGWEIETYNSAEVKASYALTFAMGSYASPEEPEHPEMMELLREVLLTETGVGAVDFYAEDDCYIDHQSDASEGGACMEAFASADALRRFIFNPKSALHTCNDNSPCSVCDDERAARWASS